MTPHQIASLMEAPKETPDAAMLAVWPDAWHYRRLMLPRPAALPWWRRLFARRRTIYWITMHDYSHRWMMT